MRNHTTPEREQRLVGADKVLLFVRSIDRAERLAIGIELKEDDGANGLTEDWSKVGRVCQRMDEERAGRARRKTCDGAPLPQEEVERQRAAARLGLEARTTEAYAGLEAMLEDEERMRLQSVAQGASLPYEKVKDRYHVPRERVRNKTLSRKMKKERPRTRPRIRSQVPKAKSGGFKHPNLKLERLENKTQEGFG